MHALSLLLITYIVCSPSIHVEDCNTSSQKTRNSLRNLLTALEYERKLKQPTIVLTTVNIKITSHKMVEKDISRLLVTILKWELVKIKPLLTDENGTTDG